MAAAPRRSGRHAFPTEKELDNAYLDLQLKLNRLTEGQPGEEFYPIETLLKVKAELMNTFMEFQRVVNGLDRAKYLAEAHQERSELEGEFIRWKGKFKDRMGELNDLRRAAGDETSTIASVHYPAYDPLNPVNAKCQSYVDHVAPSLPDEDGQVEYQSPYVAAGTRSDVNREQDAVFGMRAGIEVLSRGNGNLPNRGSGPTESDLSGNYSVPQAGDLHSHVPALQISSPFLNPNALSFEPSSGIPSPAKNPIQTSPSPTQRNTSNEHCIRKSYTPGALPPGHRFFPRTPGIPGFLSPIIRVSSPQLPLRQRPPLQSMPQELIISSTVADNRTSVPFRDPLPGIPSSAAYVQPLSRHSAAPPVGTTSKLGSESCQGSRDTPTGRPTSVGQRVLSSITHRQVAETQPRSLAGALVKGRELVPPLSSVAINSEINPQPVGNQPPPSDIGSSGQTAGGLLQCGNRMGGLLARLKSGLNSHPGNVRSHRAAPPPSPGAKGAFRRLPVPIPLQQSSAAPFVPMKPAGDVRFDAAVGLPREAGQKIHQLPHHQTPVDNDPSLYFHTDQGFNSEVDNYSANNYLDITVPCDGNRFVHSYLPVNINCAGQAHVNGGANPSGMKRDNVGFHRDAFKSVGCCGDPSANINLPNDVGVEVVDSRANLKDVGRTNRHLPSSTEADYGVANGRQANVRNYLRRGNHPQVPETGVPPCSEGIYSGNRNNGGQIVEEEIELPFHLSLNFNPLLPQNLNCNLIMGDITPAKILMKQSLLSKKEAGDLYGGDPIRFYGFIHKFVSLIRNLGFNAYEVLQVLLAHLTGDAKKLVSRHEYGSHRNGVAALNAVWRDLFNSFGKGIHIKRKIKEKLEKVGQISSKECVGKLRDLLEICQVIDVSLRDDHGRVALYSDDSGQKDIVDCLPNDMFSSWRKVVRRHGGTPDFDELFHFINNTIEDVTTLELRTRGKGSDRTLYSKADSEPKPDAQTGNAVKVGAPGTNVRDCDRKNMDVNERFCFKHRTYNHDLFNCKAFTDGSLTTDDREQYIRDNNLCFRCFRPHMRRRGGCTFTPRCAKPGCQGPHQTLLHDTQYIQSRINSSGPPEVQGSTTWAQNASNNVCCSYTDASQGSYSKVVLVDVRSPSTEKSVRCYAIIDEQSTRSFMLPDLAEALGVGGTDIDFSLNTLNGLSVNLQGKLVCGLKIKGVSEIKTYDLPSVTTIDFIPDCKAEVASPQVVKSFKHIRNYAKYFLAVDKDAEVYLLIGRDAKDLLKHKCIGKHSPFVHKTPLGFSLVGESPLVNNRTANCFTVLKTAEHFDLSQALPAIQRDSLLCLPDDELEGISRKNLQFDAILSKGTHVNEEGNITLPLPLEDEGRSMPDNLMAVYARTKWTLLRLTRSPEKVADCCKVMGAYLEAGHIEEVPVDEYHAAKGKRWFVPIFAVRNVKKSKTRMVFDSSASYGGVSLNSVLLQGPDRNNDLRAVLMRFRNGTIGVSADIEHMFHSFHLPKPHRDYVRFFWFKNNLPSEPIVQWRAKVHVFGNKPSPSCAIYGLRCAMDFEVVDDCPSESKDLIKSNCYMDDAMAAYDEEFDAISALEGARRKLAMFKIRLHKVCSNNEVVVQSFPVSELNKAYSEEGEILCGALGLVWSVDADSFKFDIQVPDKEFTPRGVLSVNHSVWDPLGLLCPLLIQGRILQRKMFEARQGKHKGVAVDWDAPLGMEHYQEWCVFKSSLTVLGTLSFPRAYYSDGVVPVVLQELHCFGDASLSALGFCIYLRTFGNEEVECSLVFAGSRVIPRSATSMPRLELCANLEVSKASLRVSEALGIPMDRSYFYTDSMISLGYQNNSDKTFSRYVTRRKELINNMTSNASWRYISSSENPADLASRPQNVDALCSDLWLHGPPMLRDYNYNANETSLIDSCLNEELPEEKMEVNCLAVKTVHEPTLFSPSAGTCGSLGKLYRIVRNVLGTLPALDHAKQRLGVSLAPRCPSGDLSKRVLLYYVLKDCQKHLRIANYRHLSPYQDQEGIIRVGGRLRNAFVPFDGKHPVLVPEGVPLAVLLVRHFHEAVVHRGRMLTHSALRNNGFYIPRARKLVESYIRSCGTCRRLRGEPLVPFMADLPFERLHESPPFTYVSLDLWGPYLVTEGQSTRRNSASKKLWGVVFICQTSRAVHVESMTSLDTTAMVNALRRFFSIRGVCRYLHSDCGSNLVACCNEIGATKIYSCIRSEAEKHECLWNFNPPGASHMMGSAERAVGSLRRIVDASLLLLGNRAITRDEMHTLFCEAASIINNTPLYGCSGGPDEPLAITPANLLTLKDNPNPPPLSSFSEHDLNSYGMQRWKRVQVISDAFWHRWRKYYLDTLQSRSKWTKSNPNVKVGDVVIIRGKQLPRNEWPVGVVDSVNSSNGVVRSCEVRTSSGTYRRAVCDLVLLSAGGGVSHQ